MISGKSPLLSLLLAGAMGAAAFIYFTWGTKDRTSEEKPRPGRAAFSLTRRDVASLALQRDGQNVVISADRSLMELRDRSLLDVQADEVELLRLSNENGQVTLARDGKGWKLKRPIETAADRVAVESLLSEVRSARVTEFVSESGGGAGVKGSGNHRITLTVRM